MALDFYHGLEIVEIDSGPRPIKTVKSSIIGLVGTAPDADTTAFPENTPVLLAGSRAAAALIGKTGTLPSAIDTIFDQVGAMVVVVRVAEGADAAATLANVVGGVDATTGKYTGVHALKAAQPTLGAKPKILLAPGFTHQKADASTANPVVTELIEIANNLRAVILADAPDGPDADLVAYREDFDSKRVYVLAPRVLISRDGKTVSEPMSSAVAGLIARNDQERGFWWSPSNQTMNVVGFDASIDYAHGGGNSRANHLNENAVNVGIRDVGMRLWGNRTCAADPMWHFLAVVRAHDMIFESVETAHRWAVDRPITKTLIEDICDSINAYGRHLKTLGAVLGLEAYPSPDLVTPQQIQQGQLYVDVKWTPVYPAEHIIMRTHIVGDYVEELI
ncbi:phage tail sheath subtilisin-like domain-containing protein [Pseudovibrio brasiliensis]|uniref:Phage tail sheath subtilisin-like domain-containing protein n=1 Tax=Pseudovibrio brasiliensis TaxID=1898042 RepID=A0ABX8AX89_9HYPH|nr:phage tail sheath subtilisin-like domain-containing protein [Pseudovibrio brasiliensis]QUS59188.1 phage tail sheath subtilisin-like domain-containing protein [Pseudovibrio brasiliensis]